MTTFWIIAGVVLVVLVGLWIWADGRSTMRNVRGRALDESLKNPEGYSTMMRNQTQGPDGGSLLP